MKTRNLLLATLLPFALMTACGGKSDEVAKVAEEPEGTGGSVTEPEAPASSAEGKDESCETFCEGLEECDGVDVEECTESCIENETTSRAGQEAFSECFGSNLCDLENELGLLGALACLPSKLGSEELSDEQDTYCNETVATFNECTGVEPEANPLGGCEDTIAVASDEALEGLNECADVGCDAIELCVMAQLITTVDLVAISSLEEGETPSPEVMADLLVLAAIVSPLGTETELPIDPFTPPDSMGGAPAL